MPGTKTSDAAVVVSGLTHLHLGSQDGVRGCEAGSHQQGGAKAQPQEPQTQQGQADDAQRHGDPQQPPGG